MQVRDAAVRPKRWLAHWQLAKMFGMSRQKPERYLPPMLLTALCTPVLALSGAIAAQLASWTGSRVPFLLIPIALIGAYAWLIPRVRLLR